MIETKTTGDELLLDKPDQAEELFEKLKKRRIDLKKAYPEIDFLLQRNGVGLLARGDIQAIKAKAKQGKTTVCSILVAALLKGEYMGFGAKKKNRVLYIDTEQNPLNTAKMVRKIHHIIEYSETENHPDFIAFSLREDAVKDRVSLLKYAISECKPDIVFLDGVRDLLEDFNAISESNEVINLLMKLSKEHQCAIVNILHTNKGLTDSNMRGHAGTELANKASEVWEVKKDETIITVTQTECRNAPVDDWAFRLDVEGLPQIVDAPERPNPMAEIVSVMRSTLDGKAMTYSSLATEYGEKKAVKEVTAKKHISRCAEMNIIYKGDDSLYRCKKYRQ